MAFVSSVKGESSGKGLRTVVGTYTNGSGDTGGDIDTGLSMVYAMVLQPSGAAAIADLPAINATFPKSGLITVVTNDDEDGVWEAVGY